MISSILAIIIMILYIILPFSLWKVLLLIPNVDIRVLVLNILLIVYFVIPFKAVYGLGERNKHDR